MRILRGTGDKGQCFRLWNIKNVAIYLTAMKFANAALTFVVFALCWKVRFGAIRQIKEYSQQMLIGNRIFRLLGMKLFVQAGRVKSRCGGFISSMRWNEGNLSVCICAANSVCTGEAEQGVPLFRLEKGEDCQINTTKFRIWRAAGCINPTMLPKS